MSLVDTVKLSYQLNGLRQKYKLNTQFSLKDEQLQSILESGISQILNNLHYASLSLSASNKELLTVATDTRVQDAVLSFVDIKIPEKMEYVEFVRDYEKPLRERLHPNFLVLNSVAEWYKRLGLPGISEKIYKLLIHKAPSKIHLYEKLAQLYLSQKQYAKARNIINKFIEINPENYKAQLLEQRLQQLEQIELSGSIKK